MYISEEIQVIETIRRGSPTGDSIRDHLSIVGFYWILWENYERKKGSLKKSSFDEMKDLIVSFHNPASIKKGHCTFYIKGLIVPRGRTILRCHHGKKDGQRQWSDELLELPWRLEV